MYLVDNRHLFITNKEIHNINTRSNHKFHIRSSNLTTFQKRVYYSGIKLFRHPLSHIRHLYYDTKLFRTIFESFFIATLSILFDAQLMKKVHVYESQWQDSVLDQMNPFCFITLYFWKIYSNIRYPSPKWSRTFRVSDYSVVCTVLPITGLLIWLLC
jgi:hypothetical protein